MYQRLLNTIRSYPSKRICVAFSGGVDSTLVLKVCMDAGADVYPVIFRTVLHPSAEVEEAKRITDSFGVALEELEINEFQYPEILENTPERCYQCKKALFSMLREYALQKSCPVIVDGTNVDDLSEFRPGLRALRELQINSPLAESHLTKADVRKLCSDFGLSVSSKPSSPCMATRLPYYTKITQGDLRKIEAGELALKAMGFTQVRVRKHGEIARIELLETELEQAFQQYKVIAEKLSAIGFHYVTLDLECFRSGSMDIHIKKEQ
ncbi:MAG: ATP-dependent sacrificial sulfur transferase LarE [Oscillospiraceae bacterium]|jgi:uncharacterized protein